MANWSGSALHMVVRDLHLGRAQGLIQGGGGEELWRLIIYILLRRRWHAGFHLALHNYNYWQYLGGGGGS